jgi:hypothetical protein
MLKMFTARKCTRHRHRGPRFPKARIANMSLRLAEVRTLTLVSTFVWKRLTARRDRLPVSSGEHTGGGEYLAVAGG